MSVQPVFRRYSGSFSRYSVPSGPFRHSVPPYRKAEPEWDGLGTSQNPPKRCQPVPVRLARAKEPAIQHRVRWCLRTKGRPVGGLTPEVDPHPLSEVTP
jgi:hypothetical protein